MPSITLTFSASQAQRLQDALSASDYPTTLAGAKSLITDWLRNYVRDYERIKAQKDALDAVSEPADVVIT